MGRESGEFYETNLIWKNNHSSKNNKSNSLARLSSLVKTLAHRNQLERYDNIIQDRIKEGIVEKVGEVCEQIFLCGDIEKAFLQVRIRECKRNVLCFHWVKKYVRNCVEIKRFTRLVFGLTQSPFFLEVTLKVHWHNFLMHYPKVTETISDDMYVNDLTSLGNTVEEVEIYKQV